MATEKQRLEEAKRAVRARAKAKVAARKAKEGGNKTKAKPKPAERTRGITNIIKKRSTQAERVFKKVSR